MRKAVEKGEKSEEIWKERLEDFEKKYPADGVLFKSFVSRDLPEDWSEVLPEFEADEKGVASRNASGKILDQMSDHIFNMVGGSADLTGSTKTDMAGKGIFQADNYKGRNLHYGVREHGMAAAVNGLALHGGIIPFGATFLVFSDYNKPSIRIAALSHIPSIFVFTHDSIGLGEDGPTHQPIEHLAALRATPNVSVFRPADANETARCWKAAIQKASGPSVMVLTRQNLPTMDRSVYAPASQTEKGAYVLKEAGSGSPDLILMATGSEVELIVKAADILEEKGVATRVVSMPCIDLFEEQDDDYKESVLPSDVNARISVEASSTFGWHKYTGCNGIAMGIDRFGISAPYEQVYEELGLTVEKVVENGLSLSQ
jgi:transketolase